MYEQRAIYQQCLAECLPGRVYRINVENQVGCLELPVRVHKNLRPKDEVEISHMYNLEIWLKPSSFCNKPTKGQLIYMQITKRFKLKANKDSQYRPTSRGEKGQGSSSANQLPLTRTNSPAKFLLELGRHDISRTRISLVFK